MNHVIQPIAFDSTAETLLSANNLPTSDLRDTSDTVLFGCMDEDQLRGIVGLELHGSVALLRSLAVSGDERGSGLGTALVAYAEQFASRQGIQSIYLLTTTAADFFGRLGYAHVSRQSAPPAIAATSQFSGLCPSSSAFMAKQLGS